MGQSAGAIPKGVLFAASYAEASGQPMLQGHGVSRKISGGEQAHPVFFPEGALKGDRRIVPYEAVPSDNSFQPSEQAATPLRPLEIVDKPAEPRGGFHPPEQCHNLVVLQMMGGQRTQEDVHRLLRPKGECIAGNPLDGEFLRSGFRGCARRVRVQVDAGELDGNATLAAQPAI